MRRPGVRVEVWRCPAGDEVGVRLAGTPEELIAAGVEPELLQPGCKGVPRRDRNGRRVLREKRGRSMVVRFYGTVEEVSRFPPVAEWLAAHPVEPEPVALARVAFERLTSGATLH